MTNDVIERASAPPQRVSLVAKMAERFSMEPSKLMGTLKATAFRSDKPVTDEQMAALLIVADQYNLNPFTKEIFAFPDAKSGGVVPVVSIDGWANIINSHPAFDGVSFVTTVGPEGVECTATIHRKDRAHPTVVTEYLNECRRNTQPWGSHPRRMLRHKALIQCARVAFGFAGIYDEDEAQRIVSKDMGPADEVREPLSTAAQRVRAVMKPAAPPTAPPVAPVFDMEDMPPVDGFAVLSARLASTSDPEIAALILDESRELDEQEQAQLAAQYRAKFNPQESTE